MQFQADAASDASKDDTKAAIALEKGYEALAPIAQLFLFRQ
jgi:hypothetical protein